MEIATEVFTIVGSVIFGLAIAGGVISCMLVWQLRAEVRELKKRVKKLEK